MSNASKYDVIDLAFGYICTSDFYRIPFHIQQFYETNNIIVLNLNANVWFLFTNITP